MLTLHLPEGPAPGKEERSSKTGVYGKTQGVALGFGSNPFSSTYCLRQVSLL